MVQGSQLRVVLVGAGGHARVCLEALEDGGATVRGCVTADGAAVAGFPVAVVGADAELAEVVRALGADAVFLAVGENEARRRLLELCRAQGLPLARAVSRHAMVSLAAELGHGVAVLAGAVINPTAVLRDAAIVNTRASVDHDCVVGEAAHVAVGATLAGGVVVGAGALVGVGAVVLPGRRVGAGAVVGGGAVVTHDVPDGATVVGVPARERPR